MDSILYFCLYYNPFSQIYQYHSAKFRIFIQSNLEFLFSQIRDSHSVKNKNRQIIKICRQISASCQASADQARFLECAECFLSPVADILVRFVSGIAERIDHILFEHCLEVCILKAFLEGIR